MRVILAVACVLTLLESAEAQLAPPSLRVPQIAAKKPENKGADHETLVYAARNTPVDQLVATLSDFLHDDDVRVVGEPNSNVLLIRSSKTQREKILKILEQIDRNPKTIAVEVYLVGVLKDELSDKEIGGFSGSLDTVEDKISDLEKAGKIYVADKVELSVLENVSSSLQIGQRIPVRSGMTRTSLGRTSSYQNQSVGVLLGLTARASGDDTVAVQIEFEKTGVEQVKVHSDDADADELPPSLGTMTLQTTLKLESGKAMLAGGQRNERNGQTAGQYLVVGVRILGESKSRSAHIRSFTQSRPTAISPSRSIVRANDERFFKYATSLVRHYDKNGDKLLDKSEFSEMKIDPSRADRNGDGKITAEELTEWYISRRTSSDK